MRPPMTATKNDGVPPSHRKTQLTQKEVLAENQKYHRVLQQQQNQPQTTSLLFKPDVDDKTTINSNLKLQTNNLNEYLETTFDGEHFQTTKITTTDGSDQCVENFDFYNLQTENEQQINYKRNQFSSINKSRSNDIRGNNDLSGENDGNNFEISCNNQRQYQIKRNQNNSNINNLVCNTNLGEVPKNLFVNNFDKLNQYDIEIKPPSLTPLPLSETEPLLTNIETTVSNSKRSICLNKNSASLIFTKKDLSHNNANNCNSGNINITNFNSNNSNYCNKPNGNSTKKHFNLNSNNSNQLTSTSSGTTFNRRSSELSLVGANKQRNSSVDNKTQKFAVNNEEPLLQQHRRSLQLNYSTINREPPVGVVRSSTAINNRKQYAYSWYAPVYSALEEEFEHDSRESSPVHNLAKTKSKIHTDHENLETLSLLGKTHNNIQPQLHQTPRVRRPGVYTQSPTGNIGSGIINNQSQSIVSNQQLNDSEGPHATSLLGGPIPRRRRFENFLKSLVGRKPSKEQNNPPLLPSPDIKISHSPSDHSLLRDRNGMILSGNGGDRITSSTTSLNSVQQKLWNVVPLLKREGSSSSLYHEKVNSIVQYSGLRKCETVLALTRTSNGVVDQIKPLNRLRNSSSTTNATCSRCSSLLSLAASGSRYSLNLANSGFISVASSATVDSNLNNKCNYNDKSCTEISLTTSPVVNTTTTANGSYKYETFTCKLCLAEVKMNAATTIGQCECTFCTECMIAYIEFEISEGAYEISCPDAQCPTQGIISLTEITNLSSASLITKHHRYRLNREIELDKSRTWCPRAGCETVCMVGISPTSSSSVDKLNSITQVLCAVQCPTCKEEFCSGCKKPWHSSITCEENSRRLVAEGHDDSIGIPFDNDLIKCCPMCAVPIEKDEGCAQMMCKRCKHVFCWYCLASLDDDFLLRHYDKGPCKNKLGHSRASVVWHRAQVIGIFAGFGILLLVASPLLLLAAPCIICCKCRICSGGTKLDDTDPDFDEAIALQR